MQPDHMPAKRTGAVVILSVHIIGDGSADGHKLSARRDWEEPACWNGDFQNIAKRDSCLTPETSRLFVEVNNHEHDCGKRVAQWISYRQSDRVFVKFAAMRS